MRDAKSDLEEKQAEQVREQEEDGKVGKGKQAREQPQPETNERREAPVQERERAAPRQEEQESNQEGNAEIQELRRSEGAPRSQDRAEEQSQEVVEEAPRKAREVPEQKRPNRDDREVQKEGDEFVDVLTVKGFDEKMAKFKREIVDELKTSLTAAVKVMAQGECEGWCKKIQKTAGGVAKEQEGSDKQVAEGENDKVNSEDDVAEKSKLLASQPHHLKSKWATYREEQVAAGEVPSVDAFDKNEEQ